MYPIDSNRRRLVCAGTAASALFLPLPFARVWAQSEGTLKLLKLPKLALVIGNSKYKGAPLRNPANDARAISEALAASGFEVTLKMDAGKADMATAVHAYVQALTAKKCVGLFYYAGHGIQLAWRNYMLPVDADVDTIADIQKQGVEVNGLLEGIHKAGNPMNVIILDACRDNPFGNLKGVDHKGLSQMDAPNQTLLAFATAPGNVASDGEGANGLYTENLLREMKVPEAKIEEVFKRVRLGVRKKSNGAQVPWESTSLEEDFWFQPPKELKRLSEEQKAAQKAAELKEELTAWERIKDSRNADDFYAYLQKYPAGLIAEQAQFRLDQLQKPKVEAAAGANGVKPLASGTNRYVVGDEIIYERVNRLTNTASRVVMRVSLATNERVEFDNLPTVVDQMGTTLKNEFGVKRPGIIVAPADIAPGKRWRTAFDNVTPEGAVSTNYWDFRVVALENIQLPAGMFQVFKVQGEGQADFVNRRSGQRELIFLSMTFWIDPTTMINVSSEILFKDRWGTASTSRVDRLISYKRVPR